MKPCRQTPEIHLSSNKIPFVINSIILACTFVLQLHPPLNLIVDEHQQSEVTLIQFQLDRLTRLTEGNPIYIVRHLRKSQLVTVVAKFFQVGKKTENRAVAVLANHFFKNQLDNSRTNRKIASSLVMLHSFLEPRS